MSTKLIIKYSGATLINNKTYETLPLCVHVLIHWSSNDILACLLLDALNSYEIIVHSYIYIYVCVYFTQPSYILKAYTQHYIESLAYQCL